MFFMRYEKKQCAKCVWTAKPAKAGEKYDIIKTTAGWMCVSRQKDCANPEVRGAGFLTIGDVFCEQNNQ